MITKLDDKYFVAKIEDLDDLDDLRTGHFKDIIYALESIRKGKGKKKIYPSYLVLNLDDEFSMPYLNEKVQDIITTRMHKAFFDDKENLPLYIKDIAVDLINAILKAKGKS